MLDASAEPTLKTHTRCDSAQSEEGFIGVGIGLHENTNVLRVYVESADSPIAQQLTNDPTYEGFPVIVEVTGKVRAFSV